MTEPSVATMLENVRTAINNLLTGNVVQSYSINGRNVQKYSLNELLELEKSLMAREAAETTGGTAAYAGFSQRPQ
jgi:hypothetical protein